MSKEELWDIRHAMKRINKVFHECERGEVEKSLKEALKLGNLDSLSSVNAELTITKSLSLEEAQLEKVESPIVPKAPPELPVPQLH